MKYKYGNYELLFYINWQIKEDNMVMERNKYTNVNLSEQMLIILERTLLIKLQMCDCSGWAYCRIYSTQVYVHRTKSYLFASLWSSSWNCSGWWQVCVNCFTWLCRNTVHISNTTVDRHRADKTRVSVIRILKWRNTYINGINTVPVTHNA